MLGQRFLRLGPSARLLAVPKPRSTSLTASILRATTTAPAGTSSPIRVHHFSTSRPVSLPRAPPAKDAAYVPGDGSREAVSMLEETAAAPWLKMTPSDPEDKLRRAATLLYQIVLYLGIPRGTTEQSMNFLVAFGTAFVGEKSEIARARRSSAVIIRAVIRDFYSIPESSPLREKMSDMYETLKLLQPLCELHLSGDGGKADIAAEWTHFWPVGQDQVLQILDELTMKGYGVDLEELNAMPEPEESKPPGSS